jgi:sodium-dependent dicarboxylate transporter 2/3/5
LYGHRYAEVAVLVLFALLAVLWLLREPRFIPGWATIFPSQDGESYFSDASTAMFIVFLMFVIPSRPPWSSGCSGGSGPCGALLDWHSVQTKLAWNVVLLLGSGFALSAGAKESGLSEWIGQRLLSLHSLTGPAIALCVSIIIALVTEVMSNVATTTLFLPVLAQLVRDTFPLIPRLQQMLYTCLQWTL